MIAGWIPSKLTQFVDGETTGVTSLEIEIDMVTGNIRIGQINFVQALAGLYGVIIGTPPDSARTASAVPLKVSRAVTASP